MTFKAGDEYALKLSKLQAGSDEIAKKAIYKAAGIVANEIKKRLKENIVDQASVAKKSGADFKNKYYEPTGELEYGLGIASIKLDKNGNWNTKIGFDGYDERHVPNQLKARVMESGSSALKKRPFVRPAVNSKKAEAQAEMGRVIDEEIEKLMGGK